ncbi:MAG: response regulator [Gammaproteobacteria bacterium]
MKRILFVDDEPQLLDGLRTRMRRMRGAWEMEFAPSGQDAIARLELNPFDVIVVDQRMPEMDGATLLHVVLTRWPRTVRIVLSGYAELEQTMRLVPVAHQYISKPCDPVRLENAIERCLGLQQLLQRPALREAVGRLGPLPPAPATFAQLQVAMSSETSSVGEIARLVARDTIITAKLLQIVNSGFFRLPRRISSVEQAVSYLGLNTVRNLVVSAEVFAKWPNGGPDSSATLAFLQDHASLTAAAVVRLMPGSPFVSDALLAALLHDIGYWVLIHGCSDELCSARALAVSESIPLDIAEQRVLGASHAEIGAYLLGIWGFPSSIVEAVAHHHSPHGVPQHEFDALAALCIAHALVEPAENGAFPALSVPHSEISADYLETVSAPFSWEEAKGRVTPLFSTGESSS